MGEPVPMASDAVMETPEEEEEEEEEEKSLFDVEGET